MGSILFLFLMTGAAVGTADAFFTAELCLYNISKSAADNKNDNTDYNKINKLHSLNYFTDNVLFTCF